MLLFKLKMIVTGVEVIRSSAFGFSFSCVEKDDVLINVMFL